VEDYLPAGNALGYNWNWQYRHTGGELLMMGARGEPSGYYPSDAAGLHTQSVPIACACLAEPQGMVVACAPLENCGATCDIALAGGLGNPDMPYLNLNGMGGIPKLGIKTNSYQPQAFLLLLWLIIRYIIQQCAEGMRGSVLGNLIEWLGCILGALLRGHSLRGAIDGCGRVPVDPCELLAGCIGGILGGPLAKLIPKLGELAEEISGWITSGLCRGLMLPLPLCPEPH